MNITAQNLQNVLRSEVNSLKNNESISDVSLKLSYQNGKEVLIPLTNKTWYQKPAVVDYKLNNEKIVLEMVSIPYLAGKPDKSDNGINYTFVQPIKCEYIDPAELSGFEFLYNVTTVTNVVVNQTEPEHEPENNEGDGE